MLMHVCMCVCVGDRFRCCVLMCVHMCMYTCACYACELIQKYNCLCLGFMKLQHLISHHLPKNQHFHHFNPIIAHIFAICNLYEKPIQNLHFQKNQLTLWMLMKCSLRCVKALRKKNMAKFLHLEIFDCGRMRFI